MVPTPLSRFRTGVYVEALQALAGGRALVRRPEGTALLVDVAQGRILWRDRADAFAASWDGREVAVAVGDSVVRIDAITGAERGRTHAMPDVRHLAYSFYGKVAWTSYAPPYDYGEIVVWNGAERIECKETGSTGVLAFVGEDRLAVAEHGEVWVVEGGEITSHFAVGTSIQGLMGLTHPQPKGSVLVFGFRGHLARHDLATGEATWSWKAPREAGFTVRAADPSLLARFPEAAGPLAWLNGAIGARSLAPPPGEGRWTDIAWVPRWERFVACTAKGVHRVDARTGHVLPLWHTEGPDVIALSVAADGAAAWATEDGDIHVTPPAPHLRKVVADEKATLSFVDGDLVVPVYTGPDFFYEMSQVAERESVEARLLRDADRLVVIAQQKTHVRGGDRSTDTVVLHAFASDDEGRTWARLELDADGISALERRSSYVSLVL